MSILKGTALVAVLLLVAAGGAAYWWLSTEETETVERTDYTPPKADLSDGLADDRLEDKHTKFDPELVDRRPVGDWQVNLSDSVLRLDVPIVHPDYEPQLLVLHPSYTAAVEAAAGQPVLPSVNMIDGKAKQFDDGLYAALDQAYYQGLDSTLVSHVELIKRWLAKVGPDGRAAPYLAAGLELAGVKVDVTDKEAKERRLQQFLARDVYSKPIGFYTWTETLSNCFRFLRYFQQRDEPKGEWYVPAEALAEALRADRALLDDYRRALRFYSKLTNPPAGNSIADLIDHGDVPVWTSGRALFPSSTSRENELFKRLFPQGLPPNADLMGEFVRRIRSGTVSLAPQAKSGWYDYQVYALETLLLPELGEEHDKLLLTWTYKKRMLEAFQALVTKRRETHVLHNEAKTAEAPLPPVQVGPRLRVEPCPSYFLRTARAYGFLANFLESAIGADALKTLHRLREDRPQEQDLATELAWQRDLFYGLYLLSAEDIGLKPAFLDDEPVDRIRCEQVASEWLPKSFYDRDLGRDTRVAVPIFYDPNRYVTRVWMTIGVRLTRLSAEYARPPRVKPAQGEGDWEAVKPEDLKRGNYLIPVDEFVQVELKRARVLNRVELRALCDRLRTKEAIVAELRK